jgi:DNA-binding NarL/FixJ family response regulator
MDGERGGTEAGLRVLIAEDHEEVRKMIVSLLSTEFQVVGAVSDGHELVDAATLLNPDVIVSDIAMPGMGWPGSEEGTSIPEPELRIRLHKHVPDPSHRPQGRIRRVCAQG